MNVSRCTQTSPNYYHQASDAYAGNARVHLAEPSEGLHPQGDPVSQPGRGLSGLEELGPDSALGTGEDAEIGDWGLGGGHMIPGMDISSGRLMQDLASKLGSDPIGEAEAMANGERGAGRVGPDAQQQLAGGGIVGVGGGAKEGPIAIMGAGGSVAGLILGCVIGRSPAGCATGAGIGYAVGSGVGLAVEAWGSGRESKDAADKTQAEKSKEGHAAGSNATDPANENTKSEDAKVCDSRSQSCNDHSEAVPSGKGMGDDQDGNRMGDPVLATATLRRRAESGDRVAKAAIASQAGVIVPGWAVQPDCREVKETGKGSEGAVKQIARHGDSFEAVSYYQISGKAPPRSFVEGIERDATNPVTHPC